MTLVGRIISCHVMSCHVMSCHVISSHLISSHRIVYWETNQSNSLTISAHKLPDSVGVHGPAGVCRSECRACCALCALCVCVLLTLCFLQPISLHLSSLSCSLASSRPTTVQRNLGKRPACKKQPKMEVLTSLGVRFWALLQVPLQLLGFASCFCGVDFFSSGCPMVRDASPLPSWRGL